MLSHTSIKMFIPKRNAIVVAFLVGILLVATQAPLLAQEPPPPPQDPPGMVTGISTEFVVTLDDSVSFTITSTDPIDVVIQAFTTQSLEIALEGVGGVSSTSITISGFPPDVSLFMSEDDLRNHDLVVVDPSGTYTWLQDLAEPHVILFKPELSTWYLDDDGWTPQGTVTQRDHTYSAWYRLDVAGDDIPYPDRHFVLETYGDGSAWSASYGLRDWGSGDIGNVYTYTEAHSAPTVTFTGACGPQWHNILVTYDAEATGQEHTVYLDGAFVTTMASSSVLHETLGLMIGAHRDGYGRNFNGWIDDVAFWDRVLTTEEIAAIQLNAVGSISLPAPADIADGLVAYWSFDSDFTATHGGSAYDGTPVHGPVIDAYGQFGGSVRFLRSSSQWVQVDEPVLIQDMDGHVPGTWDPVTKTAVLTEDVSETIQITGSGITLDGGGHVLAAGRYRGVYVPSGANAEITVRNLSIQSDPRNRNSGVQFYYASDSAVENCDIDADFRYGIYAYYSHRLRVVGNTVASRAAYLNRSNDFLAYNNNFLYAYGGPYFRASTGSAFNMCRPIGGNYWTMYTGVDNNGDGFGDTRFYFGGDWDHGQDNFPYMTPDGWTLPAAEPEPLSLVALYSFDGSPDDVGPNANHPTTVNNVGYGTGFEGQAGQFNGTSSYIDIPVDIGPTSYPEITFGAWAYTNTTSGYRAILSNDDCCYDRQIGLDPRWSVTPGWTAFSGVTAGAGMNSGNAVAHAWTFVAVRYDGCTTTLFVDDQVYQMGETTRDGESFARIGKNPNYNEFFDGLIDNLFIIEGALTDAQVESIRQNGLAGIFGVFSVDVTGTVASDCNGGLLGVTVDLDHPNGDMFTTSTDADGNYTFEGIPWSADEAVVSIVVPMGYDATTPADGQALVALDQDRVVDCALACLDPTGEARSMGYWKHQANVYLKNKGHAHESEADMSTNYPSEIFNHFFENGLNAIEVEGVTYVDNGTGAEALDLATLHATLSVKGKAGMLAKAKQQYLSLLLNMASEKLLTLSIVSDDEATASQALQYAANLINDGDSSNDELAKDICDTVNNAQLVAAGVIPLTIEEIAYAPGVGETPRFVDQPLRVSPNPGGVGPYRFSFSTPVSEQLRLEIYNVTGQRVATITRTFDVGDAALLWNGKTDAGGSLVPGVYFARLRTATGMKSVKFVHVR